MLLMFLAGGNKVFTLMLWILSMFAVAAYLIAVEYMDYELQKKLRDIAQLQEGVFDGLIELPELPAAPRLPHTRLRRRGKREALPETAVSATAPAAPETIDEPAEPVPVTEPAPVTEPSPAAQPAPAEQAAAPAGACRPRRTLRHPALRLGARAGGPQQAGGRSGAADPRAAESVRRPAPPDG